VRLAGGEDPLPEVARGQAGGVRWVAGAAVGAALVEGQKLRVFALQLGAELHLLFIHGEVHQAAGEGEQGLAGIAILFVLLNGVTDVLTGEVVLELKRGQRQAVDEQGQIEDAAALVAAVGELAGEAEAVLGEPLSGAGIARGGGAVEELDLVGAMANALAQHLHQAALADPLL
jgi:hypothetical protein